MSLPPFGLLIALLFLLGVIISMRSRKKSEEYLCKTCGSSKLVQINHETLSTKPVDLQNGNFLPGADIRLQLVQDLTYHCKICNRKSTFRVRSTP